MAIPLPRFLNDVPRPGYCIGREQLLKDIHNALFRSGAVALMHGVGGVGKTTAALAYAHDDRYGFYRHVIFLVASSDLHKDFVNSQALVRTLGLTDILHQLPKKQYYSDGFKIICDTLRHLEGELLLILDNANDRAALLESLPQLVSISCRILITSRVELDDVDRIPVDVLPMPDAVTVFCYHAFGRDRKSPDLTEVELADLEGFLTDIDRHTLLTEMMAKVARKARYSPVQLRSFIAEGFTRHHDLQYPVGTGSHGQARHRPEATVNDYVRFLFADVLNLTQSEKDFLCCLAVLPKEVYLPERLLLFFPSHKVDPTALWIFITGLHERGIPLLVKGGYALHPLLREVVLQDLRPDENQCKEMLKAVTALLKIDETKEGLEDKFQWSVYAGSIFDAMMPGSTADYYYFKECFLLVLELEISEMEKDNELKNSEMEKAIMDNELEIAALEKARMDNELEIAALELMIEFDSAYHAIFSNNDLTNFFKEIEQLKGISQEVLYTSLRAFGEEHPWVVSMKSKLADLEEKMKAG